MATEIKSSKDKAINGQTYLKMGLTDLAEQEFKRSSKLDNTNPSAKSGMATVLGKQGESESFSQGNAGRQSAGFAAVGTGQQPAEQPKI